VTTFLRASLLKISCPAASVAGFDRSCPALALDHGLHLDVTLIVLHRTKCACFVLKQECHPQTLQKMLREFVFRVRVSPSFFFADEYRLLQYIYPT
jgi:hypothetical protein